MHLISAQQSRDARRELGLSQSDVTKTLDFPRQYLSDFETGFSTRLTSSQLRKLRTFYEEKAEEANENGEAITLDFGEAEELKTSIEVEAYSAKRVSFAVSDEVSNETFNSTLSTIDTNDKKLIELLTSTAVRDSAIFGEGELTEQTLEALRESFSLLAANYLLIRSISGWSQLGLSASNINPAMDSVLALIVGEVSESFANAGLINTESDSENEGDEQ